MTGQRIAVLGAGPMGLAVAYQLAMDGYQPVIFEADDRVGGMTASFDFSGLQIERYYHFHCTSDKAFLAILDELNLTDRMRWVETRMGYWYQSRLQPWGNPLALLGFKGLGLVAKIRYGFHAWRCTRMNDWRPLDNLEASQWIKRAVGEEAWQVLWQRLFEYKFYQHAYSLSAAWIWSRIRRIGRSRDNIFREKLGYLEGGSDTLLHAMRDFILEHGGEIRLLSPVERVLHDHQTVSGIRVDGEDLLFDRVISTIPLPLLPKLLPDMPDDISGKIKAIDNIAVVCVIVKLKRQLTGNFWLNINDVAMDIPGLVEYSNLRPLDVSVVYVPFYMPAGHSAYADSDETFKEKVRRYLRTIQPELREDDFLDVHASRYRYAQPICTPGFLDKLPPVEWPIRGLWAADTSYYYPEDRGISESIDFGRFMARSAVK